MSTTQPTPTPPAAAPVITRAGTKPATNHKLFVNIPVADVQRTIRFFEALGFAFNQQFTDATATCMLVGEDAYCMIVRRDRFQSFTKVPAGDPSVVTTALFSISVESREAVDAMVNRAVEAGATAGADRQDHGFMYEWSFYDLDGHGWGVFWMDPAVPQG